MCYGIPQGGIAVEVLRSLVLCFHLNVVLHRHFIHSHLCDVFGGCGDCSLAFVPPYNSVFVLHITYKSDYSYKG